MALPDLNTLFTSELREALQSRGLAADGARMTLLTRLRAAADERGEKEDVRAWPLVRPLPPRGRACGGAAHADAPFSRLFFINLDRRPARQGAFRGHMARLGLTHVCSRFPAVDGLALDLDKFPRSVVSEEGIESVGAAPAVVNGVHLTRGALGLILSYHVLLRRIAAEQEEERVFVIAEDDAVPSADFLPRLRRCLDSVAEEDPEWDVLHIGYFFDDCVVSALESDRRELLCRPVTMYGLSGAAMRPSGARKLLECLFPLDSQIDSAMARVYDRVRVYAPWPPLLVAKHSEPGGTDIQKLPPRA